MTDNEKLAQGLALAFVQASLSGMSESDRLEELKAIKDDADPNKPNTTTVIDNYKRYYKDILNDLQ